jgi:hypothetical protein
MPRSFRLLNPRTVDLGTAYLFVDFIADIEYKPNDDYLPSKGEIKLRVPRNLWFLLSAGKVEIVEKRLCYYAIQKLKDALALPEPKLRFEIEPTADELMKIMSIDAAKVDPNKWLIIDEKPKLLTQKVFISCGQYHPNERQIGKQIKQIIDSKYGFEGYFAENQQSFDGLTSNIFKALHTSAAFVAVTHRRDQVSEGRYRGSVWVEQEIAIAAFMKQTLNLPIEVLAYIQDGIDLEGVRGLIILNPRKFLTDEDVINDIKISLPQFLDKIKLPEDWYMI